MVNTESKMAINDNSMENQYDANNDFAIFGVGNERVGGIQDMMMKMNMADKKEESSSEEEETDNSPGMPIGKKTTVGDSGKSSNHGSSDTASN